MEKPSALSYIGEPRIIVAPALRFKARATLRIGAKVSPLPSV